MQNVASVQVVNPREFFPAREVLLEDGYVSVLPDESYAVGVFADDGSAWVHEARFDYNEQGMLRALSLSDRVRMAGQFSEAHWEQIA